MPLEWSGEADEDLRQIYVYGAATFGIASADRYAAHLGRAAALIADNPRIAPIREQLGADLRALTAGSHIIVYRIVGEDILIVRVRHSREDWLSDS